MHVLRNDEFAESKVRHLAGHETFRYHPDDLAALLEHRIGKRPHQAHACASVHQAEPPLRQAPAQHYGVLAMYRIVARAGTAKHTDTPQHGRPLYSSSSQSTTPGSRTDDP